MAPPNPLLLLLVRQRIETTIESCRVPDSQWHTQPFVVNDDERTITDNRNDSAPSPTNIVRLKRPVKIKKANRSQYAASVTKNENSSFAAIDPVMEGIVELCFQEFRFKYTNTLPDGPTKNKLLLEFFESDLFQTHKSADISNGSELGLNIMPTYYSWPYYL